MKIVDRKAFLTMPAGTVYAKAATPPVIDFGPVEIKGNTVGDCDFYSQRLIGDFQGDENSSDWIDSYDNMIAGGSETPDFDVVCRDGLFDDGQLFAVFDSEDLEGLINRLLRAAEEGYASQPRRILIAPDGGVIDATTLTG